MDEQIWLQGRTDGQMERWKDGGMDGIKKGKKESKKRTPVLP